MAKYRKLPVEVEAVPVNTDLLVQVGTGRFRNDCPDWIKEAHKKKVIFTPNLDYICIKTPEGVEQADYGTWIIQGIKGELYPCQSDIFEATYEKVKEK